MLFYPYNQGSISSTFYKQLLIVQIPKAQNRLINNFTVFYALLRMLMKSTPDLRKIFKGVLSTGIINTVKVGLFAPKV